MNPTESISGFDSTIFALLSSFFYISFFIFYLIFFLISFSFFLHKTRLICFTCQRTEWIFKESCHAAAVQRRTTQVADVFATKAGQPTGRERERERERPAASWHSFWGCKLEKCCTKINKSLMDGPNCKATFGWADWLTDGNNVQIIVSGEWK